MRRLLLLAGLVACGPHDGPDSRIPCDTGASVHPLAEPLQELVDDRVLAGLPGFALAVRTPDGVFLGAAGYADLEDGVPMNVCHVHPMASVGKTWTAATILRLAEEGALDLDDPVAHHLSDEQLDGLANIDVITLRQLLNHSSGLRDFNEDLAYIGFEFDAPEEPQAPERILDWVRGDPAVFEPGEGYHYTDTSFVLLAMVIEELTGDRVGAMNERVNGPLGLADTSYPVDHEVDPPGRVNAYWEIGGDRLENISGMQAKYDVQVIGAGNVRTTLTDALGFVDGVARGDFVTDATREAWTTWNPHSLEDGGGYGLGLSHRTVDGHVYVGHTGGDVGAGAFIMARPDAEVSIVGMTNLGMFLGGPLGVHFDETLLEEVVAILEEP